MSRKELKVRLSTEGAQKSKRDMRDYGKQGQKSFKQIAKGAQSASLEVRAIDTASRSARTSMAGIAGLASSFVGIASAARGSSFILDTNRNAETLTASLETATGSAQNAEDAFKFLEDFSLNTPFQFNELTESYILLKNLGIDPTAEAMTSFGNIAAAQGKTIKQFSEAVADATTNEFERLKEFGIKTRSEGDNVIFTFRGVETKVKKSSEAIKGYLVSLGNVEFAGAMQRQMSTLAGIQSNISDNISSLARKVGESGFNQAIKDIALDLRELSSEGDDAAEALGEGLAVAIRSTADAIGFLVDNADGLGLAISGLLVARTAGAAFVYLNTALFANTGAIAGMRMMTQVSKVGAAQMLASATATKAMTLATTGLGRASALVGGPAGVLVLTSFALAKMVQSQDAAANAAARHSKQLDVVTRIARLTATELENLSEQKTLRFKIDLKEELHTAQKDIRGIIEQMRDEIGDTMSGADFMRDVIPSDVLSAFNTQTRAFIEGRVLIEDYSETVNQMADQYNEFIPLASKFNDQLNTLGTSRKIRDEILETVKSLDDLSSKVREVGKDASTGLNAEFNNGDAASELIRKLEEIDALQANIETGIQKVGSEYGEFGTEARVATKEVSSSIKGMEDALKQFSRQGANAFSDLFRTGKFEAQDFFNSLISMMAQATIQPAFDAIFGEIGSAIGGYVGGGSTVTQKPVQRPTGYATGGSFMVGGAGGVDTQLVQFMASPNEKVTIETPRQQRAAGDAPVINVNVATQENETASTQSRDSGGQINLDVLIERKVSENLNRPGGAIERALMANFGLRPQAR